MKTAGGWHASAWLSTPPVTGRASSTMVKLANNDDAKSAVGTGTTAVSHHELDGRRVRG